MESFFQLNDINQVLQTYINENIIFQAVSAVLSFISSIQAFIEYYDSKHKGKSFMKAVLIVIALICLSKWLGLSGAALVLAILGFIAVYRKRVKRHKAIQSVLTDEKDADLQNIVEDAELGDEYSSNVLNPQNRAIIEAEKCLADKRPKAAIAWLNKCNDKVRGQTKYIMRYADALIALGNYAGALAKLDNLPKNMLKKKRNIKRILVRKAICFHGLNQYAKELECYDQIIKLNFKREKYFYHRGRIKARILEAAPFIKTAEEVIEQNYGSKQVFIDSAVEDLDNALKLDICYEAEILSYKGACCYHNQEKNMSLKLLKDSMEKNDSIANTYVYLGILTYEDNNLEEGKKYFEKAIEYDMLDDKPYFYLAKISYRQVNYDEAVRCASAALALFPYRDDSYGIIGDCYMMRAMYEDAILYYTEAIKRKPKDEYFQNRALCYYNKKPRDLEKACKDVQVCLDLKDNEYNRVKYLMYMAEKDYKEGRKYEEQEIDKLVAPYANKVNHVTNIGNIYYSQKYLEKAAGYYKKAIKYDKKNPTPKFNLALILQDQEQFEEAARLLEEALETEEQDTKYFDQLLKCYRRMGDLVNETRTQYKVFELKKKHAEKYKQQGDAVYKLGKNTEAEEYYKQALILMPDTPSLLNRIACTHYWREEYQKAIDYLMKAVNKKTDYYEAYYNLGNCYLRSSQSDSEREIAKEYYLKACQIKPDFELATKILRSMNTDDIEMVI